MTSHTNGDPGSVFPGTPADSAEVVQIATANADDWTPRDIAGRAVRAAAALGLRQVATSAIGMVGGAVLAHLLTPSNFGVYGVVVFIVAFLGAFGDGGLGASLVRQGPVPTTHEYRQVFASQQAISGLVALVAIALAPLAGRLYELSSEGVWLIRMVALAGFVSSFKTIPAITLERRLQFSTIGLVHTGESLIFNAIAITLAWRHAGVMSFGVALLAQATIGAIAMTFAGRWDFGWATPDRTTLERLRFGVPYQGIAFVSLLKDSITPVLVGLLLGAASVGYVEWAQSFAAYVLLAMMTLQGLYLPTFSRVAAYPDRLRDFFEAVIHATNSLAAPIAVACLVFAKPITVQVFGPRWVPALPIFYWLWVANLFVPTATPCIGLMNALGKSKMALLYATLWAVATWVFGLPLVVAFGAVGFGMANAAVQLTNVLLYRSTQRLVPFDIVRTVRAPWLFAAVAGVIAWVAAQALSPTSPAGLIADVSVLGLVYAICMLVWERSRLQRIWRLLTVRLA